MTAPDTEVEGQLALFDLDLNPTPEVLGFDSDDESLPEIQEPPC